jgi:hypothetical protein
LMNMTSGMMLYFSIDDLASPKKALNDRRG